MHVAPLPERWTTRPRGLFEARAGRLVLLASRCARCRRTYVPARDFCPPCRSGEAIEATAVSGRGVVHTFSVVRQSAPEFPVPYVVAYADLVDGVRLLGQVTDCPPEAMRIGMPVQVVPVPAGTDSEGRVVFTYRLRPIPEAV